MSDPRSRSNSDDERKKKKEKKSDPDKAERRKKKKELERKKKELEERIKKKASETNLSTSGGGGSDDASKNNGNDKDKPKRGSFRSSSKKKSESPGGSTNGKDAEDKKAKKAAKEAKNKEEKERKEKLKQEQKELKKAEKEKKNKEKNEKKLAAAMAASASSDSIAKKRPTIRLSGPKKAGTVKSPSKSTGNAKREILTNNPLMGKSVPNLRKKKSPTFIAGFSLDPFSHDKSLSMAFDEKKKAELQARKLAAQARPASGFSKALLDEQPRLQRTTSFISRSFLQSDTNTPRDEQLRSMKRDNFWFSTISFIREREEGKRKASVDSLESQLSLKWDDFMASLPKIEKPRQGKVRDGYDEEGVKALEDQGAKILSALQFKPQTPDRTSVASKFALKEGQPPPSAIAESLKESIDKVVLPSYLKGFTGEEPENVAPTDSGRLAKYAVCMIQHANPNIAVDAKYDMLFGECASEDPGVYIWRIEYFMPLEIPEDEYPDPDADEPQRGILYSEDCYIILHISSMNESKKFTIFTWIGKKATRDKIGAAAIRSRELNILLKNKARVSREMEGEESDDFLELYDYDVQYMDSGGTETGFKPALPFVQEPRMYRLHFTKEKILRNEDSEETVDRWVFNMTQVRLSALSLTKSDVFILDGGTDGWLWQWNGSLASKKLRFKGHEIITRINRYERGCRSVPITLEEGQERNVFMKLKEKKKIPDTEIVEFFDPRNEIPEDDEEDERSFWDYMREREFAGDGGMLPKEGPPIACDIVFCKTAINPETNKPMLITLKKAGEPKLLSYKMLDANAAFIMDADTCLFTWIGKRSSELERQIARALTKKFKANQKDRASWAPIIEVQQGAEPACFITKFPDWCAKLFAPLPSNFATAQHTRYRIAPANPAPVITFDMLTDETLPAPERFIDDCQGTVEVWAIEDGKPTFTKLPPEERGHFYSGDCFLVLYTYYDVNNKMKQAYLCYFWEGRSSIASRWWPAFLFGFYPVLEKKIKTYGGNPPLKIRVAEHKEPPHFCKLFGGNIIIHKGHRRQPQIVTLKPKKEKKKALYHIRRTTENVTHTVQVRAQPKSLHSGDAFVLLTPQKAYLWYGSGTGFNDSNAFMAAVNALKKHRDFEQLDEGEEVPAFWNILGGWTTYTCNQDFVAKYKTKPRLYRFSTSSGRLTVKEVLLYYQTDLKRTNVYILDTSYEVYAWAGKRASESLYKQVLDFANKYVREMALRRKRFVELISVAEGEEPLDFTRHFHTWVAKDPFLDPILAREEKYTDLLFQEYKKREQEEKKKKEKKAQQRQNEIPLLRLDWMEIVRREIPDLVVDDDEYGDYTDDEGGYSSEDGNYEDGNEDEDGEGGGDGDFSSDEEITIANLKPEKEEEKKEEKTVADYYIEKVNQSSRNYKLYNK